MLQVRDSVRGPRLKQPRPLYAGQGFVQERSRYSFPRPHDRLQRDQLDHCE